MKLVDEHHDPDPLIGMVIDWPNDHRVRVLSIEGEYDDDTTCVYVDGPYAGSQTMRDTFTVRRIAAQQRRNQASP